MLLGLFGRRGNSGKQAPAATTSRDSLLSLAREHLAQRRYAAAEVCLDQLMQRDPGDLEAQIVMGVLHYQRGAFDEAEAAFRAVLAREPDNPTALANAGQTFQVRGDFSAAQPLFEAALRFAPSLKFARFNLAVCAYCMGDVPEAIRLCRELVAADPDDASAHIALGEALLAQGDYEEGWAEYEWRMREPGYQSYFRRYPQPEWDGCEHPGLRLLIWPEQGFGDTLQFSRLALMIARRHPSMTVLLEAPTALARLMRFSVKQDTVPNLIVVESGSAQPAFDMHASVMSLSRLLGVRLDRDPLDAPYLFPDPAQVAVWQEMLIAALPATTLRVGLAWAGNRREQLDSSGQAVDARRSLPPELAARLLTIPGCTFVSLQVGPRAGELAESGAQIVDLTKDITDFADTAALMAGLDLIVSVDTAVVHLAGSLGRPVWMLSRYDCCWRWGPRLPTAPWYPTLKPYYQPGPGDWEPLISEVSSALAALAHDRARSGVQ